MSQQEAPKVTIVYSELSEADQTLLIEIVSNAVKLQEKSEKPVFHKDVAEFIKKELDTQKGGVWNCVSGLSFGSYVTHETRTLCHVSVGALQVMVWRHG